MSDANVSTFIKVKSSYEKHFSFFNRKKVYATLNISEKQITRYPEFSSFNNK